MAAPQVIRESVIQAMSEGRREGDPKKLPLDRSKKYLPYAFTGRGFLMLSSVLRSDRAVQVNVAILRTERDTMDTLFEKGVPAWRESSR